MKKRILALILFFALFACLLPGAHGLSPLCFVATNDSVPLILYGGENPYYSSGKLYIPHNSFDANPNGVGVSYNAEKNTFVLFNRDQTLIFDLKEKTYTDRMGKTHNTDIVYRGGVVYLPAAVASHFGLSVTLLFSRYGYPIVRFTNGGQVYDDGTFVAQAENLINRAAEDYEKNNQSGKDSQGNDTNQQENDAPSKTSVYLAFAADAVSAETLDMLKITGATGVFFLTEEQILTNRNLVREIYAAGHKIGLTVMQDEWDISSALKKANEALDQVIFCKSLFVLLPRGLTFQTNAYCILPEPAAKQVDDVLNNTETDHILVVRTGGAETISALFEAGAALLRLRETSF